MAEDPLLDALKDVREQFARLAEAKNSITIDHVPRGESWQYTFRAERDQETRFRLPPAVRCGALLRRRLPQFVPIPDASASDFDLFLRAMFSYAGDKVFVVGEPGYNPPGVISLRRSAAEERSARRRRSQVPS